MADMKANAVTFTAPYTVEMRDVVVSPPAHDHLLVNTQVSAVSAGTEMLFYRGQVPADLPIDSAIASLAGQVKYPALWLCLRWRDRSRRTGRRPT